MKREEKRRIKKDKRNENGRSTKYYKYAHV